MGIKPSYIKSTGLELITRFSDKFTNDFEDNKQVVTEMTSISSKRVRNRVAGFITRKINTGRHS